MQLPGALRRPLRSIIKSIGTPTRPPCPHHHPPNPPPPPSDGTACRLGDSGGGPGRILRCQSTELATHRTHRGSNRRAGRRENGGRAYSTTSASPRVVGTDGSYIPMTTASASGSRTAQLDSNKADFENPAWRKSDGRTPRTKRTGQFSPHYADKVRSLEERRANNRKQRHAVRDARHDYLGAVDWRDVLEHLDRETPAGEEYYCRQLETVALPPGVTATFRQNVGASILEIQQRTGCHVQLIPSTFNTLQPGEFSNIGLLGTPLENSAAQKILPEYVIFRSTATPDTSQRMHESTEKGTIREPSILEASKPMTTQATSWLERPDQEDLDKRKIEEPAKSTTDSSRAAPVRSTWAVDRRIHPTSSEPFPPRPSVVSFLTVTAYVTDLVRAIPRLLRRSNHRRHPESGPIEMVTAILVSIFSDADIVRYITSEALDVALRFLLKYSKLPDMREIYRSLEANGYAFTASNFNVLLDAPAAAGDVHNFRFQLTLMSRNRVAPTPQTWAKFHQLLSQRWPSKARIVAERMRAKGLLANSEAATQVTRNSISSDLKIHLSNRGNITEFIRMYDSRVQTSGFASFHWLTVDVMSRMVYLLLLQARRDEAIEVLDEFRRRSHKAAINAGTLSAFLTPAVIDVDPEAAVAVLSQFHVGLPGAVIPNHVVYSQLFNLAWSSQNFNMLRVIWRYACAAGQVSWNMQLRIWTSLRKRAPQIVAGSIEPVNADFWMAWAGKFAIGVVDGLRHGKALGSGEYTWSYTKKRSPTFAESAPLEMAETCETQALLTPEGRAESTNAEPTLMPTLRRPTRKRVYTPLSGDEIASSSPMELSSHEKTMIYLASSVKMTADQTPPPKPQARDLFGAIETDLGEVYDLKPVRPLAALLEEAYHKDQTWSNAGIGQPKGIENGMSTDQMFETMMRDGVKVPMIPGNFWVSRFDETPWVLKNYLLKQQLKK